MSGIKKLIVAEFTDDSKNLTGKAYADAINSALSPEAIAKNNGTCDDDKE
jgi:hypothetical protein